MEEDVKEMIDFMKENPETYIDNQVNSEEVNRILSEIGQFIRQQLLQTNTVVFHGLGLFGLSRCRLPVSQNPVRYVISQKPVFQISHTLAERFQIRWARKHYEVALPEKELNYSSIAFNCSTTRSNVTLMVQELIICTERRLYNQQRVQIPIPSVGIIRIQGRHYRMEFDPEFLEQVSMDDVLHVVEP